MRTTRTDYAMQPESSKKAKNKNIETFVNDKIEKALIFSKSNIDGNQGRLL